MLGFFFLLTVDFAASQTPKFDENCPLSGQSLYGWQVRIWDDSRKLTVAHGSIISYQAVVSGCSSFDYEDYNFPVYPYKDVRNYQVIGQKVLDMRKFSDLGQWCTQYRKVKQIILHPKCLGDAGNHLTLPTRKAFDFSLFILDCPFETGNAFTYPAISLPATPTRMLQDIAYLNVANTPGCEIPVYKKRNEKLPIAQTDALVWPFPFHLYCIERYCNRTELDSEKVCQDFLLLRANATQLCVWPTWTNFFPKEFDEVNWYLGAPFSCNGTSYGHAGHLKQGSVVPKYEEDAESGLLLDFKDVLHDFFYVPTYLRVWPWLQGAKFRFGGPWLDPTPDPPEIETESFDPPKKLDVTDQILPFRAPRMKLTFPPDKQKIWYRSAGSTPHLSVLSFFFLFWILF